MDALVIRPERGHCARVGLLQGLDLATHPDCQHAWGEADAAQVWGEAYFANHEPALAHRAFKQALAVRKRIERPGVAET